MCARVPASAGAHYANALVCVRVLNEFVKPCDKFSSAVQRQPHQQKQQQQQHMPIFKALVARSSKAQASTSPAQTITSVTCDV